MTEKPAGPDIAANYIRENFTPVDRLAIVLLNKEKNSVIQRIAVAEKIAAPDYQAWLRQQNSAGYEVYISMNALRDEAKGRTKADIGAIRHIYLDLDRDGDSAVKRLRARTDLPKPNYLISTSPGKWQVVWKAEGFTKEAAEALQKSLAAEIGGDPAATDCARVLRLPGFYNHKYSLPHSVTVEAISADTYQPDRFPVPIVRTQVRPDDLGARIRKGWAEGTLSQSERDWSYAKRALARGDSPALVAATIASYRRYDKHNPQYYAELTVKKASATLRAGENLTESQEQARA